MISIILVATLFVISTESLDYRTPLCKAIANNTVLRLNQAESYAIKNPKGNDICTVERIYNFTLTSNVGTVIVTCVGSAGLVFMNSVNISISNIIFRNCGGMVDTTDTQMSSETKNLLNNNEPYLVVSLMYIDCQNISLQQVSILEYNGFGVLIINTMNTIDIHSLTVSKYATNNPRWQETREADHLLLKRSKGGTNCIANSCTGITLIFDKCSANSNNILINNSVFILNEHQYMYNRNAASGLSIITTYNISCDILKFRIFDTRFNSNVGISSSIYVKGSGITVLFKQCSFSNNIGGSGVNVWISNTNDRYVDITFDNCLFRNHSNVDEGGALSVLTDEFSPCKIMLRNVTCNENTARINGHCAFIHCKGEKYRCMAESLNIILENVHAQNNGKQLISIAKGIFVFNGATVYIKGNDCLFMDNIDSALMGIDCDIYFNGNSRFINNQALSGGVMHFIDSFANFYEGVVALFKANVATIKGGAIYMYATNTNLCSLQFHFNQKFIFNSSSINMTLHFIENKALIDANSIYAYPVYNCYQRKDSNLIINSSHLPIFYNQLFHNHHTVLSIPEVVWLCNSNDTVSVYPGKFFTIEFILLDGNNNSVYGEVYLIFNNSWSIPYDQRVQPILPGKCNLIYLNIFSYATKAHGTLSIQSRESMASTKIQLFMEDCPHGLVLLNDSCVCHPLLSALHGISCDAEKGLINVPIGKWVGLTSGNELAISNSCVYDYCGINITTIPVGNLSPCINNREGILCGRCKPGYSVVFGTSECQICSNYWLFTIVGFGLLGIALIVVLFKLKISISSGWFNAIVFYANLYSIATENFSISDIPYPIVKGLVVWLSFLNLDLGFPLCFYSSMTSTIKAMLQFVFPCYLILLVIGFIIVSRYSTRISRMTSHFSVQVLATLIFLSYTKIIRAVVIALQFSSFQTANGTVMNPVWYGDGNVKYFQDIDHCILCIIAVIVFAGVILPYTVLLTVLPFMYKFKWVNRIRPFLDAHYGPYKDKYQWWFAVRLWLIVVDVSFATIFHHYIGYLLLAGVIVTLVFILIQVWMRPFKNKFINALEILVIGNWMICGMVVLTTLEGYLPLLPKLSLHIMMGGVLVGCIFILFCVIFLVHVFKVCKSRNPFISRGKQIYMESILGKKFRASDRKSSDNNSTSWDYDTGNYREPLISDSI